MTLIYRCCVLLALLSLVLRFINVDLVLPSEEEVVRRLGLVYQFDVENPAPKHPCELCGQALERLDYVAMLDTNPFFGYRTLSIPPQQVSIAFHSDVDSRKLEQIVRTCLRHPKNNDCERLSPQLLQLRRQFIEDQYHAFLTHPLLPPLTSELKDFLYHFEPLVSPYLFRKISFRNGERFDSIEYSTRDAATNQRALIPPLSLLPATGDPLLAPILTSVWFLRDQINLEHISYCLPICEAKMTNKDRRRARMYRWYLHHCVYRRVRYLQLHTGTILCYLFAFFILDLLLQLLVPSDAVGKRGGGGGGSASGSGGANSNMHSGGGAGNGGSGGSNTAGNTSNDTAPSRGGRNRGRKR